MARVSEPPSPIFTHMKRTYKASYGKAMTPKPVQAKGNAKAKAKSKAKGNGESSQDSGASRRSNSPGSSTGWKDNPIIVGLDFGSSFSSMVYVHPDGEREAVNTYPEAPPTLAGRPEEICETPSKIAVSRLVSASAAAYEFEIGFSARNKNGVVFDNLKAFVSADVSTKEQQADSIAVLGRLSRGRELLTPERLVEEFLKGLWLHLYDWCESRDLPIPNLLVAAYPIAWDPTIVLKYARLLENAGWPEATMVNEGDAAVESLLVQPNSSKFGRMAVIDLGGMTYDCVFYEVTDISGTTVKEELSACIGGYGGMGLVDSLAKSLIERQIPDKNDAEDYVQEFSLSKTLYNPQANDGCLTFGRPKIVFSKEQMAEFFAVALQPIIDNLARVVTIMETLDIPQLLLVGGTSLSRLWLKPHLNKLFKSSKILTASTSAGRPMATFISRGATYSGSQSSLTRSRISKMTLGHIVTTTATIGMRKAPETWGKVYKDRSGKEVVEVVELIKRKNEVLFASPEADSWHVIEVRGLTRLNFREVLQDTETHVVATALDDHTSLSRKAYYDVAPLYDFELEVEPRHIFRHEDIERYSQVRKGPSLKHIFYGLKFFDDGLGLSLQVGWQSDYRWFASSSVVDTVHNLGRVRLTIGEDSKSDSDVDRDVEMQMDADVGTAGEVT